MCVNNFIYQNKTKVFFGEGCAKEFLTSLLEKHGKNVMFAYGNGSIKSNGIYDEMKTYLEKTQKNVIEFSGIMPNPTYAKVKEGAELAVTQNIDLILAVGGGSVIDCCKVISAQARTDRDLWTMEFEKRDLPKDFIPMIAVVTASGTGAEMNNGAVITNEEKKIKAGMVGAQAYFALLDPNYTLSVPMKQVISGAFDTLSHCMETYFGKGGAGNLSDDINEAVMRSVIRNIRSVIKNPQDIKPRSELMWASSMAENGILKIGKITDFQCHQMEHQLGAYTDCNHGQGLSVIHPAYYRHIYKDGLERFAVWSENVWEITSGNAEEKALAGINALADFIKEIGLPTTFREMGINKNLDFKAIANSCNISAGSLRDMTHEEFFEIFKECL